MENFFILTKYYDPFLVLASIFIAIAGSYASIELNSKLARTVQSPISLLFFASVIMGLSIWSMHFIGMAAFSVPIVLNYDWGMTLLSVLPPIAAAGIAFLTLYRSRGKVWQVLLAGFTMGIGIASMHYLGMAAIEYPGIIQYEKRLFILSVIIAIVVSFVALYLFKVLQKVQTKWITIPVAIVMGIAISGMHYTGMASSEFCLPVSSKGLLGKDPIRSREFLGFIIAIIFIGATLVITGSNHTEKKFLQRMLYRDRVTDLVNDRWFYDHYPKLLTRWKQKNRKPFFALLEINEFKWANDTYGYEMGDELLFQVAHRYINVVKENDRIIRYKDSKFLFVLENVEDTTEVMEQLLTSIRPPFRIYGNQVTLTASIGVLILGDNETLSNALDVTKALEQATKAATMEATSNWVLYNEKEHSDQREKEITEQLKRNLATKDGFYLCFQPKVNLVTGKINSAEVLVRWENDKLGFVSPGEFISIAEKYGYIHELTKWIFTESCKQLKIWKERNFYIQELAINLSATHFQYANGNEMIKSILKDTEVEPKQIHIQLEITETAVMENFQRAVAMMVELKEMGMSIALDDFGKGLSSLTYLKHLPIDTIKIDKVFIDGIPHNEKDAAIIEFIIELAKKMDVSIVAEGIEDKRQADFLKRIGCHYGQGYFFSKPKTKEQLENE